MRQYRPRADLAGAVDAVWIYASEPSDESVVSIPVSVAPRVYPPMKEPALKPWGQTVAYVRDLNGFLVELGTEMQP